MAESKPVKAEAPDEGDSINLKVVGQDGNVIQVKMRRDAPLGKLMRAYCQRFGLSMELLRFRYDGKPVHETHTSAALQMEEGDIIDVFQQQTGGAGAVRALLAWVTWGAHPYVVA